MGSVLGDSSQRAIQVRIAGLLAGIPDNVPVHTVNRCEGSLQVTVTALRGCCMLSGTSWQCLAQVEGVGRHGISHHWCKMRGPDFHGLIVALAESQPLLTGRVWQPQGHAGVAA